MRPLEFLRHPLVALTLLYGVFLACLIATSQALPERVASHFGLHGEPDGWMTRSGYLRFMAILGLAIPLFFLATSWVVRSAPASVINLPRRDYWLSSEHRPETNACLTRRFLWFAWLVLCFFLALHLLVVDANRQPGGQLSGAVWVFLAIFLAAVAAWCVALVRHFSRLPSEGTRDER